MEEKFTPKRSFLGRYGFFIFIKIWELAGSLVPNYAPQPLQNNLIAKYEAPSNSINFHTPFTTLYENAFQPKSPFSPESNSSKSKKKRGEGGGKKTGKFKMRQGRKKRILKFKNICPKGTRANKCKPEDKNIRKCGSLLSFRESCKNFSKDQSKLGDVCIPLNKNIKGDFRCFNAKLTPDVLPEKTKGYNSIVERINLETGEKKFYAIKNDNGEHLDVTEKVSEEKLNKNPANFIITKEFLTITYGDLKTPTKKEKQGIKRMGTKGVCEQIKNRDKGAPFIVFPRNPDRSHTIHQHPEKVKKAMSIIENKYPEEKLFQSVNFLEHSVVIKLEKGEVKIIDSRPNGFHFKQTLNEQRTKELFGESTSKYEKTGWQVSDANCFNYAENYPTFLKKCEDLSIDSKKINKITHQMGYMLIKQGVNNLNFKEMGIKVDKNINTKKYYYCDGSLLKNSIRIIADHFGWNKTKLTDSIVRLKPTFEEIIENVCKKSHNSEAGQGQPLMLGILVKEIEAITSCKKEMAFEGIAM